LNNQFRFAVSAIHLRIARAIHAWILHAFVVILIILAFTNPASAVSGQAYLVCNLNPNGDNFLALREGPSSSHRMLMTLGPGSIVEARGTQEGKWLSVVVEHANDQTFLRDLPAGYVYTDYLCPI
jgi:hypothetical protein